MWTPGTSMSKQIASSRNGRFGGTRLFLVDD